MDDAGLRERVVYMYLAPERVMNSELMARFADAGLHRVADLSDGQHEPVPAQTQRHGVRPRGHVTDRSLGRTFKIGLLAVVLVYLHDTLPYLTMMPRVNVDEPWLMERAYQVMRTGIPTQPMLGLHHAYLLQVGYGYLAALWMAPFGVGILQARLLGVALGLGIVVMVAWIGRRTIDPPTGLGAALFLALDSNFLGGVRNARTDIPSVFFVTAALAAYLLGREQSRKRWFVCSGACVGLAMLCHGNAFWAGLILAAWYILDYGARALVVPYGYAVAGGLALTFGPYLAMVLVRWHDVQEQIGNFAADRVPGWRPSFVLHQITLEAERYRGWYFGLVTNTVPNPLLWAFQLATVVGVLALAVRVVAPAADDVDRRGPARLLILAAGGAFIFAAFINNKVPVYLPHLLIGFSLAAGFAVSEAVNLVARIVAARSSAWTVARAAQVALWLFILSYGGAGVAYYEKWYSSNRKGELVSYEATSATLRALVPAGPKYLYASPQFWTPFHDEPGATFYSYAAAWPVASGAIDDADGCGRGSANLPHRRRIPVAAGAHGHDVVDFGVAAVVARFHRAALRAGRRGLRDRARHAGALPLRPDGSAARESGAHHRRRDAVYDCRARAEPARRRSRALDAL